jgi:hypothetical protein
MIQKTTPVTLPVLTQFGMQKQCASIDLCFEASAQGEGDVLRRSDAADFTVWNFGQHPAAGFSRLNQYRDSLVNKIGDYVRNHPQKGRPCPLLWASTMPVYRNDAWVRGSGDGRTLQRAQLWNDVGNGLWQKAGVNIFPEWALTMPFLMDGNRDVAHWSENMRQHHLNVLMNAACPSAAAAGGG